MTLIAQARRKPALKAATALLSLSLLLPACETANVGAGGQPLEAGRQTIAEEVGLGEAQVDLLPPAGRRQGQAQVLALAEQVAFLDRNVANDARRR